MSLRRLTTLCKKYVLAEDAVTLAAVQLQAANEAYNKIRLEQLPDLFAEVGIEELVLDTGDKITVKADCDASIKDEDKKAALAWLRKHKFGGLIKVMLGIDFEKGEATLARRFAKQTAAELERPVKLVEGVHPATLRAFVKEQLEEGYPDFPMELFSVYPYNVAKLKRK